VTKIVIARGEDQHWIYFSVRDDADNGSIIDFVQRRRRCTLGDVRRELRPWIGGTVARTDLKLYVPEVVPVSTNRAGVIRALAAMRPVQTHRYLEEERAIPRELLGDPRFEGRILVDARSNAVFPQFDRDGPCGYEIKNHGFTGFAPGGEKGLWMSRVRSTDTALVIAESAIDALSYVALHPDENTRYASFGGTMNPSQPAIIEAVTVDAGKGELAVDRVTPPETKDWNDVLLRAGGRHSSCVLRRALSTHCRRSARRPERQVWVGTGPTCREEAEARVEYR
jgi:hypothetical protein